MMDRFLLDIRIRLEMLITERESMIAFNIDRVNRECAIGYNEAAFLELNDRIKLLHAEITGRRV